MGGGGRPDVLHELQGNVVMVLGCFPLVAPAVRVLVCFSLVESASGPILHSTNDAADRMYFTSRG